MPRPPPVTKARFPVRSITTPAPVRSGECGMRNYRGRSFASRPPLATPHSALRIPHSLAQPSFHEPADQVLDGEMHLLDSRGVVRGDDQSDVSQVLEPTARMPEEAPDRHPTSLRALRGAYHVGAFAARRVERQHVAGARQGLYLTCEYLVEPHVIGARGEERAVGGERDGAQRRPVGLVAHDVLGREMLRVRRATAVAGEEQRPVGAQGGDVRVGDRRDRPGVLLPDPRRQRRQGREPRAGLLGGRHSTAACTSACKSAAEAPGCSSAVPTTTKSAPAVRATLTWAGVLIPPPTNSVSSGTAARQARITSGPTGHGAPLPASK